MRQGPFLLQPAPLDLGIIESTASDIAYILAGDEDSDEDTEPLGVVVIVFSDGRVDMCLDTEKIEARDWEGKGTTHGWMMRERRKKDEKMYVIWSK